MSAEKAEDSQQAVHEGEHEVVGKMPKRFGRTVK